jgi:stage II sporulation protein P
MSYKPRKRHGAVKFGSNIVIVLVVVVFIAISLNSMKGLLSAEDTKNYIYISALNHTVPLISNAVADFDDGSREKFSLRNKVLEVFGIDIYNPMTVLSREMSVLRLTAIKSGHTEKPTKSFVLNPFNLNENSIFRSPIKKDDSSAEGGQTSGDLPNRDVSIYDPSLKKELDLSKPQVLIYHTHTTESFKPGDAFKDDESKNIVSVGVALARELENNYGISVIHDRTMHSAMYIRSYQRSGETLDKYLAKYGDFDLIIDMHRDSGPPHNVVTTRMNGENVAKIMFVMNRNNPRFAKNQEVVNKLRKISDRLYPDFCRGVLYYNNGIASFNQNKSDNAILLEVGTDINTLTEAQASAKYIARIIAEYINGK